MRSTLIILSAFWASTTSAATWQGRLTSGTQAARGQFPNTGWVSDSDLNYKFVASCWIFNSRWVVSKAFGSDRTTENTKLILGTAALTFEDKVYNHTVIQIINHPSYNAVTLENNLSLMQTKEKLYFTEYVRAFLPHTDPLENSVIATVVGFGQSNVSRELGLI